MYDYERRAVDDAAARHSGGELDYPSEVSLPPLFKPYARNPKTRQNARATIRLYVQRLLGIPERLGRFGNCLLRHARFHRGFFIIWTGSSS